jgi:hypothetical protein
MTRLKNVIFFLPLAEKNISLAEKPEKSIKINKKSLKSFIKKFLDVEKNKKFKKKNFLAKQF